MTARVLPGKPLIGPVGAVVETSAPIDPSAIYRRLQDTGRGHRPAWMVVAPVVVVLVAAGALIYATTNKTPAPATAPSTPSSDFQNGPASGVAPSPSQPAKVAAIPSQPAQASAPVAPLTKPAAKLTENRPAAHVARTTPHRAAEAAASGPNFAAPAPPATATIEAPAPAVNAPVPAAAPSIDLPAPAPVNPSPPQA